MRLQKTPPRYCSAPSFSHGRACTQVQCDGQAAHTDMGQLPLVVEMAWGAAAMLSGQEKPTRSGCALDVMADVMAELSAPKRA